MNKKKLKRREEKEENNKTKKDPKAIQKRKNLKSQGVWSHQYILTPKYCRKDQRSYDGQGPSLGQKGTNLFLEIVIFGGCIRSSEAAMGEGRAPFGMLVSPIWRVRAAHGRARAAKTHQSYISSYILTTAHIGSSSPRLCRYKCRLVYAQTAVLKKIFYFLPLFRKHIITDKQPFSGQKIKKELCLMKIL